MQEAAIGVVYSEDRQFVLLVKRRDVPVWVLPGGGIDLFESPEDAVVREVFEETGLKVSVKRKIAEYTPINKLAAETHLFECENKGGSLTISSETSDARFFPCDQLPAELFPVHRDWFTDACLNLDQVIYKPISQVTYWALFAYLLRHPILFLRFLSSRFSS